MQIELNGEKTRLDGPAPVTIRQLLERRGVRPERVALALNGDIIPREDWDNVAVNDGDVVDIVHAVAGGSGEGEATAPKEDGDPLVIAGETFRSRLFLGTGRFPDTETMVESLRRSGTEMVTVAIRLVNIQNPEEDAVLPHLIEGGYRLLPNTAGATSVEQAVRMARLSREATGTNWIKLEVIGDDETLWPDVAGTVEATRILVKEGFTVLPYTSPDIVAALRLEDAGAATVMPLASLIGSGQGVVDWDAIERIARRIEVPVIVDAGIGAPSDAALAMELGCDAVLLNTAVSGAKNPPLMAEAMAAGVRAGRAAYLAGRIPKRKHAVPSSPPVGVVS